MHPRSRTEFGHADRRSLFEYIERHGVVDREQARRDLEIDEAAMRHHIAIMRRDGIITVESDELRIDTGETIDEEHVIDDGTAYTIRPANETDLSGIVGAIRAVVSAGSYVEAETVAHILDHEEVVLRFNQVESRMFFVATVDEEVIGWVHLNAPEVDKLAHTAELTLGVLDAYRGHGIGGELLRRGLDWAAENKYERLYQSVPATNEEAITFLEHHGWTIEAVRADHYRIDGENVDEVMMATKL